MFYAHFVLSKKGPLAKVWLAAHWDKKLTKTHVFETDVEKTVDDIISPKVKMALRTSGHLLLGVVRIYSRKQKYLIQDLGEACAKIKMAFRPGIVDLPVEGMVAVGDTITLPEIFQNFESAVADLGAADFEEDRYQSRAEDITLRDDVASNRMFMLTDYQPMDNNEFGGMLEDIEVPRKSSLSFQSHVSESSHIQPNDVTTNDNLMDGGKRYENRGLEIGDMGGFGDEGFSDFGIQDDLLNPPVLPKIDDLNFDTSSIAKPREDEPMEVDPLVLPPQEETLREDEGFVLEPIDVTGLKVRQKRKRKLVIDKDKELQGHAIRAQLQDPSDTMRPKMFPPPKRKALLWRDAGSVDQLYHTPVLSHLTSSISSLITRNQHMLSTADAKMDAASILTDTELPREEVGGEVIEPSINEVPIVPEDMSADMREPEFELLQDHEAPPLPLGVVDEEEHVSRIIPELPDLEVDAETEPTPTTDTPDHTGEERRWNRHTQQVLKILDKCFEQTNTIHFTDITRKCSRKQAASCFYSCLLLAKEGTIQFEQKEPYSTIIIKKNTPQTD